MARQRKIRPTEALRRLARWGSNSIGQMEALAGVNIQCEAERRAFWEGFRHLYGGEPLAVVDAVMDHCATTIFARVERGELSLLPRNLATPGIGP